MAMQDARCCKKYPAHRNGQSSHAGPGTRLCAGHTPDPPSQVLFGAPEAQRKSSRKHSAPHLGVTSQPLLLANNTFHSQQRFYEFPGVARAGQTFPPLLP